MRIPVELRRAYRLLNHGPVTLVTTAHAGRTNVMAAQWVMPIDFDPPKLALVIAQDTFTRTLLESSGECVVNVPVVAQADLVSAAGHTTGHGGDKLADLGIPVFKGDRVAAPCLEGCAAWLECRVVPEPALAAAYDLFIAEVVAASAENTLFDGRSWTFADDARRTLHHLAGGSFFATGPRIDAK